jgi:hypothetical protein
MLEKTLPNFSGRIFGFLILHSHLVCDGFPSPFRLSKHRKFVARLRP